MSLYREDVVALVPQLRAFARSLTAGHTALADDLVQDTILKALEAQEQFAPGTNLRAWLFTILRNTHLSHLRRQKTRNEIGDDSVELFGSVPAPQEGRVEVIAFRRAFAALSEQHRTVLVLVCVEGLPYDEVARVMKCEVGTVKSRVNRARAALRKLILGGGQLLAPRGAAARRLSERAAEAVRASEVRAGAAAARVLPGRTARVTMALN
jgi:RNA polymerase sigma-70 factor (ECF subfamily)